MSNNILEMIKLFLTCNDNRVAVPTFLIFMPEEVPLILGESTVSVTHKITEMYNKLDILIEKLLEK